MVQKAGIMPPYIKPLTIVLTARAMGTPLQFVAQLVQTEISFKYFKLADHED